MSKSKELILQGRPVMDEDIATVKKLLVENPGWCRSRLSRELCKKWDWVTPSGQMKDMACRSYLRKLEQHGYIQLPPCQTRKNGVYAQRSLMPMLHDRNPIIGELKGFSPIEIRMVEKGYELDLFKYYLSAYHYLGWSGTVGENLKYLVLDQSERVLGCVMFGASAWKVEARDSLIGWDAITRKRNLSLISNNNRFLILPWVRIKHLASHILGRICRRIGLDFMKKYNHPVYLLETFVEKERFKGTCYQAANWKYVGDTKGRGKLDRKKEYKLPLKSIWLYPLSEFYREQLKK